MAEFELNVGQWYPWRVRENEIIDGTEGYLYSVFVIEQEL